MSRARVGWVALAALAMVALLLLGGLFPEADPIRQLPGFGRRVSLELVIEAPAKAHEARNWALFGEWHRNPADEYQFWRIQSPVWVYPLSRAFRLFGTSYTTLRWFGLAIALLGLVGFLRFGRQGLPGPVIAVAALLLSTNLYFTQIARSGLVEIALNTAAVGMLLCLFHARRHPGWLVAAQVAFTAGFYAKSGMVFLFPLLVGWNIGTFLGYRRRAEHPVWRWVPVLTAALIAAFTVYYVVQPEYQRVLSWNTAHLLTGYEDSGPWVSRLDMDRIYRTWVLLFPVVGALTIPGLVALAWQVVREGGAHRWRLLLLLWAVSAGLALIIARSWTLRHSSVVFLPGAMVIGWSLWWLWRAAGSLRFEGMHVAIVAFVLLAIGVNSAGQVRHLVDLRYESRYIAERVMAQVGRQPAVVVGRLAVPLLLGTPYDVFYVKQIFNTDPSVVRALAPTHVLRRDPDIVDRRLRGAMLHIGPPTEEFKFRGKPLLLSPVDAQRDRSRGGRRSGPDRRGRR